MGYWRTLSCRWWRICLEHGLYVILNWSTVQKSSEILAAAGYGWSKDEKHSDVSIGDSTLFVIQQESTTR